MPPAERFAGRPGHRSQLVAPVRFSSDGRADFPGEDRDGGPRSRPDLLPYHRRVRRVTYVPRALLPRIATEGIRISGWRTEHRDCSPSAYGGDHLEPRRHRDRPRSVAPYTRPSPFSIDPDFRPHHPPERRRRLGSSRNSHRHCAGAAPSLTDYRLQPICPLDRHFTLLAAHIPYRNKYDACPIHAICRSHRSHGGTR
jgi:hypothetical protein